MYWGIFSISVKEIMFSASLFRKLQYVSVFSLLKSFSADIFEEISKYGQT